MELGIYFPKYDMKIMLGDFNANIGRKNIYVNNRREKFIKNKQLQWHKKGEFCNIKNFVVKPTTFI